MKKIYIAEDDQGIIEALTTMLEFSGYEPVTADLENFIDHISAVQPELILLDLQLGSIESHSLFQKIKYDKKLQKIPVVIVSANAQTQEIADKLGADAFVEKPFDMDNLLAIIEKLT